MFIKMQEISLPAEELQSLQEGLRSLELVKLVSVFMTCGEVLAARVVSETFKVLLLCIAR
jgi:hypothetical protein